MKFILAIICLSVINLVSAQTKVPAVAEAAFKAKFPTATAVKWDKENKKEYEAEFMVDGKKCSANFSNTGVWMETERAIAQSAAPKAVLEAVANAFPKATIKEVYEIETKDGKHYFEVEYIINKKTKEAKFATDGSKMK